LYPAVTRFGDYSDDIMIFVGKYHDIYGIYDI